MLMAKLKMPVIVSEELISFNRKLIEVDEKFCIPGEQKTNKKNPKKQNNSSN